MGKRYGRILFRKAKAKEDAPVRHVNALLLKLMAYVMIFGTTMPVLGKLAPAKSLVLAAFHTLLLWLADCIILPRFARAQHSPGTRNLHLPQTAALVGDFLLLLAGSFFVLGTMGAVPRATGLVLAVLLGTLFEAWFHSYLIRGRLMVG